MFLNWIRRRTRTSQNLAAPLSPARRRPALTLERLEDRTVPTTFNWTGATSNDWATGANWTDVNDPTNHVAPGAADTAVINSSPNDPILGASTIVGGLTVAGGSLTLNANLKDTGTFTQSGGSIGYGANGVFLIVQGDIDRTAGTFANTSGAIVGNVQLSGQPSRHITDTSGNALPNLKITNDNFTGIIVDPGSSLAVTDLTVSAASTLNFRGNTLTVNGMFNLNGKLILSQPTSGAAAPVAVTGALNLAATTAFDLTVASSAGGSTYDFLTYSSLADNAGATYTIRGNGAFTASVSKGATTLAVTISGDTFTWTGGTSGDWNTGANWTDALGFHAVPGAADTAVIKGAPFDPVVSADATVGNVRIVGGYLLLHANLTDLGSFYQSAGFVGFGADTNLLTIDGGVTRTGGVVFLSHGTVVLAGSSAQTVDDTSNHALPHLNIANSAGVTLTADSLLVVTGLDVSSGTLILNSDLTDTGAFTQEGGNVFYNAGVNLTLEGDLTRTNGTFTSASGVTGTVVLAGSSAQTVTDTSSQALPNLNITNTSSAGVTIATGTPLLVSGLTLDAVSTLTLQGTATLSVSGDCTDDGTMYLTVAAPNNATAPVTVAGTMTFSSNAFFDFTMLGSANPGDTYLFVQYGNIGGNYLGYYQYHFSGPATENFDNTEISMFVLPNA
jgi:hypothetical protein